MNNRLNFEIAKMMDKHREYFAWEISEYTNNEKHNPRGFDDKLMVEIKRETGLVVYMSDLWTSIYSPTYVYNVLPKLEEQYGELEVYMSIAKYFNKKNMMIDPFPNYVDDKEKYSKLSKNAHILRI